MGILARRQRTRKAIPLFPPARKIIEFMQFALRANRLGSHTRAIAQRSAHLIGAAGAGMSALANVLVEEGWKVTGSDLNPAEAGLPKEALVYTGHRGEHVADDTGLVVYSDAIDADNEERRRAWQLGVRQFSYPRMLGLLMQSRHGVAVAGTHGKSTTTAMVAEILVQAGMDPTVIGGGAPLNGSSGGRHGTGPHLLVEACEYHRNFLHLCPKQAVITGVELDHVDCFSSVGEVEAAFAAFAARLPQTGSLLVSEQCSISRRVAQLAKCGSQTFGFSDSADWRAINLAQEEGYHCFDLRCPGGEITGIRLRVPGRHNASNALAAAGLAAAVGASHRAIAEGLNAFEGLKRRLERVGTWNGAVWYDDYAHHPTEVRAVLLTIRQMFPSRRIWCIFQPHQLSRARHLLDEFADSLQNADCVAIAEVFAAREPGGADCHQAAMALAQRAREGGVQVQPSHTLLALAEELEHQLTLGDVLLTLGAGDIRKVWNATRRIRTYRAAG